ncbi:GNAT family N-acetyltransferase [Gemmata sp.]|uniref:GNAT family N-acetyltransferase n=1 Tax=Gemmata sp. TaxID=1914242 RepID=UPI003F703103
MRTANLNLVLLSRDNLLAEIAAMEPEVRAQLSADWLAQLAASAAPDPWVHWFALLHRESGAGVGRCGFKGPPDPAGAVEIAYGIDPGHQGKGYATEAAAALVAFAFGDPRVAVVRAHTLPDGDASKRVLGKCGFRHVGEVVDPDDGLVWRWEKVRDGAAASA